MVTRMGHIALRVPDLDAAVDFQREVIGMVETERTAGASYMTCNERHHELILIQDSVRRGYDHIGLEVADTRALEQLKRTVVSFSSGTPLRIGDVDAARRHADLYHVTPRDEILLGYVAKGRAEFRESRPNTLRIPLGTFDPKIDIARGARQSMSGYRVCSDEHELNLLCAKRGQYVAEV